jgi:adenylate kinase
MSAMSSTCGAVVLPSGHSSSARRHRAAAKSSLGVSSSSVLLHNSLLSQPRVASAADTRAWRGVSARNGARWECKASGPLKVIIAGAPASGKGTQVRSENASPGTATLHTYTAACLSPAQCELIVQRFGLAHISAGDLLRAEVAAGTPAGKRAKDFMDRGDLVPDEVRLCPRGVGLPERVV